MKTTRLLSGMPGFLSFWVGQVVSLLGTAMTQFALTIWAYELTGSATALALVGFFFITPMLIISPVAGALVDRSNRKFMMMVSDLASGLATIFILALYLSGRLEIWHLYVAGAFTGTFQSFQWPAFSAAMTTMIPKEQYGRANGLMSLAETGSGVFAPLLAGALLGLIGLAGIMFLDIVTFIIAILALLIVSVPQPRSTEVGEESKGSLWQESIFGFWYIIKRPSLLGLQLVFMFGNFITGIPLAIIAPLILAHTNNNEITFGTVSSAGAAGASAADAPAAAPSSTVASSASTLTVAPSAATSSTMTPATGQGTSTVTLSVSSSQSISSTATASPGPLNQVATVASVTDSPSVGTRISVMLFSSRERSWSGCRQAPNASSRKAFNCARCLDIVPAAVEADAARPT